jgi:hypothetical protein
MFRAKNYNLFFTGCDYFNNNGANANLSYTAGSAVSGTLFFTVSGTSGVNNAVPIPGTGWSSNGQPIYNSQIFANVMAWAINTAASSGINSR